MKRDKILVIEEFVNKIESQLDIFEESMAVMTLTPDQEILFRRSNMIIRKKIQGIKDAEDKSSMNAHLKVKKLLGDKYE